MNSLFFSALSGLTRTNSCDFYNETLSLTLIKFEWLTPMHQFTVLRDQILPVLDNLPPGRGTEGTGITGPYGKVLRSPRHEVQPGYP